MLWQNLRHREDKTVILWNVRLYMWRLTRCLTCHSVVLFSWNRLTSRNMSCVDFPRTRSKTNSWFFFISSSQEIHSTATNIVSNSINCIEYVLIKHLISEVIWTHHIYILHWGHELAFPTVIIQILTKYFRKLTTGDNIVKAGKISW